MLRAVKGFRGRSRHCIRLARNRYEKSLLHAFVGRKLKQRAFRATWIGRINAASRLYQLPYNRLISGLQLLHCQLNRKQLAQLAVTEPATFRSIVDQVKLATAVDSSGQQQQVEQQYPSYGKVYTALVVTVKGPVGGAATHRRLEAQHTRAALEAHYAQQREEKAREAVQQVTITETAKQ